MFTINSQLLFLTTLLSSALVFGDTWVGEIHPFSGNKGEFREFSFSIPDQAIALRVESVNGQGDIDIFVYPPDSDTYLGYEYCDHRKQGAEELCRYATPKAGIYKVKASAQLNDSSAQIKLSYLMHEDKGPITIANVVTNGERRLIQDLQIDAPRYFKYIAQPNLSEVNFKVSGNLFPVELSISKNTLPTKDNSVCTITAFRGDVDTCTIEEPYSVHYIKVSSTESRISSMQISVNETLDPRHFDEIYGDPDFKELSPFRKKHIRNQQVAQHYYFELNPGRFPDYEYHTVKLRRQNVQTPVLVNFSSNDDSLLSCTGDEYLQFCFFNLSDLAEGELLHFSVPYDETNLGNLELMPTFLLQQPWPNGSCDGGCGFYW